MSAVEPVTLRVADIETGGMEPEHHDVVELGWTDVMFDPTTKTAVVGKPDSKLFGAPRGIPAEAQAVHHITPAMVEGLPPFTPAAIQKLAETPGENGKPPMFMVAHNAAFDRQWLVTEGIYWICTMKVARRLITGAPSHGNQALRYHLGLEVDPVLSMPSHRAGPDSYVTACLLAHLISRAPSLSQMEAWTRAPLFYPSCPLKKHKGQAWADIPADYLRWIMKAPDMERDIRIAAEEELESRRAAAEEAAAARQRTTLATPLEPRS